jgi:hypothetical protein
MLELTEQFSFSERGLLLLLRSLANVHHLANQLGVVRCGLNEKRLTEGSLSDLLHLRISTFAKHACNIAVSNGCH